VNEIDGDDEKASAFPRPTDALFVTHNGCTFSSFGVSEITFDKNRVYRAAGYRLAWKLANLFWLGEDAALRVSDSAFKEWTNHYLYLKPPPAGTQPASFVPEALMQSSI